MEVCAASGKWQQCRKLVVVTSLFASNTGDPKSNGSSMVCFALQGRCAAASCCV